MCCVYLLVDLKSGLFKIGHAKDAIKRIARLKSIYPDIDMHQSWIIQTHNARSLESLLHYLFQEQCNPREPKQEGYTEWFNLASLNRVLIEIRRIKARYRPEITMKKGIVFPLTRPQPKTMLSREERAEKVRLKEEDYRLQNRNCATRLMLLFDQLCQFICRMKDVGPDERNWFRFRFWLDNRKQQLSSDAFRKLIFKINSAACFDGIGFGLNMFSGIFMRKTDREVDIEMRLSKYAASAVEMHDDPISTAERLYQYFSRLNIPRS